MSTPRFSVIIPAYNSANFISRAIESVLAQHHAAHEIIVVDDGSQDPLQAALARYTGQLRYLRQDNAGVSAARNLGAREATGDWLCFLDADDWYYPHRLADHANLILSHPDLDFLTGDYDYVQPDGSRISGSMELHTSGRQMLAKAANAQDTIMLASELEEFVAQHFGDTHTLSVPRASFLKAGGYPTGYRVAEDVFLLTRLCAKAGRIGVSCRPLAAYLIHDGSATRRNRLQAQRDNVKTLTALESEARQLGYPAAVLRGTSRRLVSARLNLAYALRRDGQTLKALIAAAPNLMTSPGWSGVRSVLSIIRG